MGKKIGRAALAVGTMGGSEVVRAAGKKLGIGLEDEQGAYVTPEAQQAALYRAFANDYDNQMKLADKGVQESDLTKGLFGQGGLQSQLSNESRDLASRGFQLQQEDREAYGQVSGDVTRMFGQQEQAATQALARRGLASASSGAAGATFSGLQGNKNEMVAKAQMQIAQNRMQDTQKRLMENRRMQGALGEMGAGLAQQRYDTKGRSLMNAMDAEGQQNAAKQQALANQQAAVKPGLFSTIGQGLQAGIGNLATQAPGMLVTGGIPMGGGGGGMTPGAQQPRWDTAGSALGTKQNTWTVNTRSDPSKVYG